MDLKGMILNLFKKSEIEEEICVEGANSRFICEGVRRTVKICVLSKITNPIKQKYIIASTNVYKKDFYEPLEVEKNVFMITAKPIDLEVKRKGYCRYVLFISKDLYPAYIVPVVGYEKNSHYAHKNDMIYLSKINIIVK